MRFLLGLVVIFSFSIIISACAQGGDSNKGVTKAANSKVHGTDGASKKSGDEDSGMAAVIKKKQLPDSAVTFGQAIDGYHYFNKREWKESRNSSGTFYVDFTGWFNTNTLDSQSIKDGIASRGIQVKFAIYGNGSFGVAMVSKVEAKTDGKIYMYPLEDRKGILDSIYANKEISF